MQTAVTKGVVENNIKHQRNNYEYAFTIAMYSTPTRKQLPFACMTLLKPRSAHIVVVIVIY